MVLSCALDLRVSRRWHLAGEWDALTDFKSTTQDEKWGLAGGMILEVSSRVWWDAALRFGTNSEDDNYTLTTGLTLTF
jgi:hypothetical protein